jgi:hypothetical protein
VITIAAFYTGFVVQAAINQQLEILIPVTIALAILTWFGSGADLMGLLRDWLKEMREEENTPTFEYDDLVKIPDSRETYGTKYKHNTYLLGISNVRRRGIADDCHAFLYLEGSRIVRNLKGRWSGEYQTEYMKIGIYGEMELFVITDFNGKDEVVFHTIPPSLPESIDSESVSPEICRLTFEENNKKKLTVIFGSKNGNMPEDYFSESLEDIVKKAIIK